MSLEDDIMKLSTYFKPQENKEKTFQEIIDDLGELTLTKEDRNKKPLDDIIDYSLNINDEKRDKQTRIKLKKTWKF